MGRRGTIGLSEEQAELLETATKYCAERSPIDRVRRLIDDDLGHAPEVFGEMAELGWLGIAIPEAHGGAGLELAEVVPVVEQMGRNLMAGPFVSTTLAAQALLWGGSEEQKARVLPELASGTPATVATMEPHADWNPSHIDCRAERSGTRLVLSGEKCLVVDAKAARWIVVSLSLDASPALVLLDAEAIEGCEGRRETVIDETRRCYRVKLDGLTVPQSALLESEPALETLERLELAGSLLAVAEIGGGGAACIDYTVRYLKDREQFGRPIGSYQALKHPVVDAHVGIEQARSHLYAAAHTFGAGEEGEVAVRMAKAQAGPAFAYAADRAIQFHGGFGFTYECDAQLYRRRAFWCEAQHGDALYHRRRLAETILRDPTG